MSAYLWRLTDHHAVFYTDDRSILNAVLAYARFPHQDLTQATTYHGKNNRIFAWQFTFPMAVWNGLVRHLGRASVTFLDEEKPTARKAASVAPEAPEPAPGKAGKRGTAKPETLTRAAAKSTAAGAATIDVPRTQAARSVAAPPAPAVTAPRHKPTQPLEKQIAAKAEPARINARTGEKPASASLPGSGVPTAATKKAAVPVPAPIEVAPVSSQAATRRKPAAPSEKSQPAGDVLAKAKKSASPTPAPAPKPEGRGKRPAPVEPAPVVGGRSKATASNPPVSTGGLTKVKTPAPKSPVAAATAVATTVPKALKSAPPAATPAPLPARKPQARVAAGVAAVKSARTPEPAGKKAPVSPPATVAAKPARATAAPKKAASTPLISEVTRTTRSATPAAGVKRVSALQGELLTVPATGAPVRPRTREKVPR